MSRQSSEQEKFALFASLTIFMLGVIASAIFISRKAFPYFRWGTIIFFVLLVVVLVRDAIKYNELFGWEDYWSVYVGAVFLICLVGAIFTDGIGYGLGGTSLGQTSIEVFSVITGAQQTASDAFEQSINQLVEENCKTLSAESCKTLRAAAKTAKTAQEVSEIVDKLKKAQQVAEIVAPPKKSQ